MDPFYAPQSWKVQPNKIDVLVFLDRLQQACKRLDLHVATLGLIGPYPLLLANPEKTRNNPHILIAAGFHGEEAAGPMGLLQFLEQTAAHLLQHVHLSVLPLVNPSGFSKGTRSNLFGENPNNGFCSNISSCPGDGELPSHEGRLLLQHLQTLSSCSKDGFLSLHEDIDLDRFYLYSFEQSPTPGTFTKMLVDVESSFFSPIQDGTLDGAYFQNGVAFLHHDGSFEDLLFHQGCPRSACTETPGRLPLPIRIQANAALSEAFVHFYSALNKNA
jgi:hypothetical protein